MSSPALDRERVRATLVLGLVAAIIGLRLFQNPPTPYAWVPTAFGVLLLYWALYAGATAYGISSDLFSERFCVPVLRFGHRSFKFALYVLGFILVFVLWEWSGMLVVLEWRYWWIGAITIISFWVREAREFLTRPKEKTPTDYVKANWVLWVETMILASFLFAIDSLVPAVPATTAATATTTTLLLQTTTTATTTLNTTGSLIDPTLLTLVVAVLSSMITAYLTNRWARHRLLMELKARTYDSMLLERGEELKNLLLVMKRTQLTLSDYTSLGTLPDPETYNTKIVGLSETYRKLVVESVYPDTELHRLLLDVLGSFRTFESAIGNAVYQTKELGLPQKPDLEAQDWDDSKKRFKAATKALREALGVEDAEAYLKSLRDKTKGTNGEV